MSSTNVSGVTAPNKPSATSNTKPNRLPAPTLFVGPPSRNASQLSVARAAPESVNKSGRPGAFRTKSALKHHHVAEGSGATRDAAQEPPTFRRPSEKSIDAKWREMQSTLNEVELSAQSSTHVFGESHAKALDDLRQAQVALARAWGRGSEEKEVSATEVVGEMSMGRPKNTDETASESAGVQRRRAETEGSVSTVLSDESQLSESSVQSGRSQLEDETAQDIKLASERRAANEAYFKRVDAGVKEVVEKLEKVAEAMRDVEGESRSLWSSDDRSLSEEEQSQRAGPSISVS